MFKDSLNALQQIESNGQWMHFSINGLIAKVSIHRDETTID